MALTFVQVNRAEAGFSAVMTYLAARKPFDTMPLGAVAQSVSGAIKRGHYVLAVEDNRVVGVTLWALTSAETAGRWTNGEIVPPYEDTVDGDTVVLMLGGGDHPRVALGCMRHVARRYPGRDYLMNRFGRKRTNRGRFPALGESPAKASGGLV